MALRVGQWVVLAPVRWQVVLSLAEHLVVLRAAVSLAAPKVASKRVVLRPVALPGVLVAKVPRQVWPLVLAVVLVARHKIEVG